MDFIYILNREQTEEVSKLGCGCLMMLAVAAVWGVCANSISERRTRAQAEAEFAQREQSRAEMYRGSYGACTEEIARAGGGQKAFAVVGLDSSSAPGRVT